MYFSTQVVPDAKLSKGYFSTGTFNSIFSQVLFPLQNHILSFNALKSMFPNLWPASS